MNQQQKAFADAWLINGHNGTRAAIEAGYEERSAYSQAWRLLKDDEVAAYINEKLKEKKTNTELELARWLDALEAIAYADIDQAIEIDTGNLKPSNSIPAEIIRAVERIEVDKNGRRRISLASKTKALELLGRHRAFLKDEDKPGVTLIFQAGEADGLT